VILPVHNLVEALAVEYRLTIASPVQRSSVHKFYAAKSLRRRDNFHLAPNGSLPDLNENFQFYAPGVLSVFDVNRRLYEVSRRPVIQDLSWKVRCDLMLLLSGWWPESDDEPPPERDSGAVMHLRHVLSSPAYAVAQVGESTNGTSCVVIQSSNGRDILWLDPQFNYAIRQRQWLNRPDGDVIFRQDVSEFANVRVRNGLVERDFWFPKQIAVMRRDRQGSPASEQRMDVNIISWRVNSQPEKEIAFNPPPGTVIVDRDTGDMNHVPGGMSLIEDNIHLATSLRATNRRPQASPTHFWDAILIIGVAANGLIIFWTLRLWYRSTRDSTTNAAVGAMVSK
jgi:hypothetical protein